MKSVRDGTGNNAMTAQRKWIADCLLARKYIDQAQHTTLNELADGGQAIEAVDLGLDEAAADALLSGQFETFAALIVNAWEAQLTAYLKEAAKKDPTNPFFKGKTEAEINGAVFEICRRSDPPPIPATEDPPDETDKTHTAQPPKEKIRRRPRPFPLEVFYPADPNDKVGPQGFGPGHFVTPGGPMPYVGPVREQARRERSCARGVDHRPARRVEARPGHTRARARLLRRRHGPDAPGRAAELDRPRSTCARPRT